MKSTYKVSTLQVGPRGKPLEAKLLTSLSCPSGVKSTTLTHSPHTHALLAGILIHKTTQRYKHAAHRGPVASATQGQRIKHQHASPATAAWATVNLTLKKGEGKEHTCARSWNNTHAARSPHQHKPRQDGKAQPRQHAAHTISLVHFAVAA